MTFQERIEAAKGTCADMALALAQLEGRLAPAEALAYLEHIEDILLEDLSYAVRALTVLTERKLHGDRKWKPVAR